MHRIVPLAMASLALLLATAPGVSAHEHYLTDDGEYSLVLGEQNEPVYTYDWTNLDFIVTDNATDAPVSGVHETVNATLVAPGGEEHQAPIEPQFGEEGRYAFVEDYYLTQPGQYEVRLEGHINGSSVDGTYDLPGPRQSMADVGFPAQDVPSLLDLEETNAELRQENQELREDVDRLETRLADLESNVSAMDQDGTPAGSTNDSPGPGAAGTLAALAAGLGLLRGRRD